MRLEKNGKPRPIEFLARGIDVADMLHILDQWDTLTAEEKTAIGFEPSELLQDSPFQDVVSR